MGVLWYIPGRRFPDGRIPNTVPAVASDGDGGPLTLSDLGLGFLAGARLTFRGVHNRGPDGGAGLVIGLKTRANETGIFSGQQWTALDGGELFIGWPEGLQPGPEVFERTDTLRAKTRLVLGDGNEWGFVPSSALPAVLALDASGQMTREPRPGDAAHFEASDWLFRTFSAIELGQEVEASIPDAWRRIVTCLQTRYHVDFNVALALRLCEDSLVARAAWSALGVDFSKKNEVIPSGSVSSVGAGD